LRALLGDAPTTEEQVTAEAFLPSRCCEEAKLDVQATLDAHESFWPLLAKRAGHACVTKVEVDQMQNFTDVLPVDYRKAYMQWRCGGAHGAKGEARDVMTRWKAVGAALPAYALNLSLRGRSRELLIQGRLDLRRCLSLTSFA